MCSLAAGAGSNVADFGVASYTTACELLNITPVQRIVDGLRTSLIALKYRSLGPGGAKALAAALMVSTLRTRHNSFRIYWNQGDKFRLTGIEPRTFGKP